MKKNKNCQYCSKIHYKQAAALKCQRKNKHKTIELIIEN